MKKIKIIFFGASVTEQSVNQVGKKVGYVDFAKKFLLEKYEETEISFLRVSYAGNHLNDAGYFYFNDVIKEKPDILIMEWHSTDTGYFNPEIYDFMMHSLVANGIKTINLALIHRDYINTERQNIRENTKAMAFGF